MKFANIAKGSISLLPLLVHVAATAFAAKGDPAQLGSLISEVIDDLPDIEAAFGVGQSAAGDPTPVPPT